MEEKEFEQLWKKNKEQLLLSDQEYMKAKEEYKMKSGADWLLFAIPVVAGIVSMDYINIERELLKWLVSAGITIITFIICVWVKSLLTDTTSLSEIEERVKQRYRESIKKD
jgi:hypothetical protein